MGTVSEKPATRGPDTDTFLAEAQLQAHRAKMSYAYVIYMQNSPLTGPLTAKSPFATSSIPAETL